LNDQALEKTLRTVTEALKEPEVPDLADTLENHELTLSNMRQQAMADIDEAEQAILRNERLINRIDRARVAIHAYKTEMTRP
jgi:flagellar motor component MotA